MNKARIYYFDVKIPRDVLDLLDFFERVGMAPRTRRRCKNPWGNCTLGELIRDAIRSTPLQMMNVHEIHRWLAARVDYFKEPACRLASIRNSLCAQKRFLKASNGKVDKVMWMINPCGKFGGKIKVEEAVQIKIEEVIKDEEVNRKPRRSSRRTKNRASREFPWPTLDRIDYSIFCRNANDDNRFLTDEVKRREEEAEDATALRKMLPCVEYSPEDDPKVILDVKCEDYSDLDRITFSDEIKELQMDDVEFKYALQDIQLPDKEFEELYTLDEIHEVIQTDIKNPNYLTNLLQ